MITYWCIPFFFIILAQPCIRKILWVSSPTIILFLMLVEFGTEDATVGAGLTEDSLLGMFSLIKLKELVEYTEYRACPIRPFVFIIIISLTYAVLYLGMISKVQRAILSTTIFFFQRKRFSRKGRLSYFKIIICHMLISIVYLHYTMFNF